MSSLGWHDVILIFVAVFGGERRRSIVVEELLKRDVRDATTQGLRPEGIVNKPNGVESGQSGDRPSRLKG